MKNYTTTITLLIAVLGLVFFQGCAQHPLGAVKVTGTVTVDGAAMEGVSVTFSPNDSEGREAYGTTDADGRFVLTIPGTEPGSGAIPGDYIVTFAKMENPADGLSDEEILSRYGRMPDPIDLLPTRYKNRTGADVTTATVEARGRNDFPFALTSR